MTAPKPPVNLTAIERDVLHIIHAEFPRHAFITMRDLVEAAFANPALCPDLLKHMARPGIVTPRSCQYRITMLANRKGWQWRSRNCIRNPVVVE